MAAQSFQVQIQTNVVAVQVPISYGGNIGDVNVSIWDANAGGFPNAQLSGCSDLNSSLIPVYPSSSYIDFNFSQSTNCSLNADTNYFIVLREINSAGIWPITSTDIYPLGLTFRAGSFDGNTWLRNSSPNRDFFFRLWTDDANFFNASFLANKVRDLNTLKSFSDQNAIYDFNFVGGLGAKVFLDANWFVDGIRKKTLSSFSDINFHYEGFNLEKDYNVSLILKTTDGSIVQNNLSLFVDDVSSAIMGIDIVANVLSYSDPNVDVNFSVIFLDVNVDYIVWGGFPDGNRIGQTVNVDYNVTGVSNVCVTLQTISDVNTIYCEYFFNTNILVRVPKNERTLVNVTPFNVSLDTVPFQNDSNVSGQQTFWVFWQTPRSHKFSVDINSAFFPRNYVIFLDANFSKEIQPYVIEVIDGIEVIFTTLDSLSSSPLENINLFFTRNDSSGLIQNQSGTTDSTGRVAFNFIPNIDHNFNAFNDLNFIAGLKYTPVILDASIGVTLLIAETSSIVDLNTVGGLDINYLNGFNVTVVDGNVELTQIISLKSNVLSISSINIMIDHNGVNLYNQTFSSGVGSGGTFVQDFNVLGLKTTTGLVHTILVTFSDGSSVTSVKTFFMIENVLGEALESVQDDEFGVGGTMILLALFLSILFGFVHVFVPSIDNNHSFFVIAFVLLFFSLFGWIDGITWVFGAISAGALYFSRRVNATS